MRFLAAMAAMTLFSGVAHGQEWKVVESAEGPGACSTLADLTLCLSFKDDGVWFALANAGFDNFGRDFPAYRVDAGDTTEVAPQVILEVEALTRQQMIPRSSRAKFQTWRGLVPSPSGEWTDTPAPLITQMIGGSALHMRVRFEKDRYVDVNYPLKGFCAAARQLYPAQVAPLNCKP